MPSLRPVSAAPAAPPVSCFPDAVPFPAAVPFLAGALADGSAAPPASEFDRSMAGGWAGVATGADTLRRTPTMRAAPVRVPKAAAVLRRIDGSSGSELEWVEVQLTVGQVQPAERVHRG